MIHLSASKIRAFDDCPEKFRYQYVKKAKQFMAPATRFGILIHKIFEDFHRWTISNKDKYSEELARIKMKNIFAQRLAQYNEIYPSHIAKLGFVGVDLFNLYIQEYLDYFLENKLYTRIFHPEKNLIVTAGDYQLRGKIDLFIEPNVVIDFKSGEHEKSGAELLKNLQVNFYSLVTSQPISFSYFFVKRPMEVRSFSVNKPRDIAIGEIIHSAQGMLRARQFPKKKTFCAWCPYRFDCQPAVYRACDNTDSLDFEDPTKV